MPYTYGGGYYQGDYYRGDPFIHKRIGGVIKKIGGVLPGPIGTIATTIGGILSPAQRQTPVVVTPEPARPRLPVLTTTPRTTVERRTGIELGPLRLGTERTEMVQLPSGEIVEMAKRKRRGINPMNPKALKRATRRIDRFTKQVRSSLKHTPYTLTRRGARRGGSPGVITRSEAARALRK